ncbi:DUF2029 domain-containing protein [Oleomonas cavernae]|uniref:DUF2029 domain-containing protein n=1 Tax=Oleomonas cavernae TaxID=2320859 RepID=A0A418WGC4_9PROT|nr:glycosyltransferase family 87 protein [Oleomonas cavernae]RJF89073.1 DUF2029 domain-containing protein [Oleomonas cavernae]
MGDDLAEASVVSPLRQQVARAARVIFPFVVLVVLVDQWPFLTKTFDRGQVFGRDAYNLWTAGRLALEGRTGDIADSAAFARVLAEALGPESNSALSLFLYPPPALLFVAPFGWLPYPVVLALWSILGAACFVMAVGLPRLERPLVVLALVAPMTLVNLVLGQNGLFSAALFIGGLRLAGSRPVFAGVLIGLLAYKPMMGCLLPLVFVVQRQWRVVLTAGATLALACFLPVLFWGPEVWSDYLEKTVPLGRNFLEHGTGIGGAMRLTPFTAMRLLGAEVGASYGVQAAVSLVSVGLCLVYLLRRGPRANLDGLDILVFSAATALVVPYLHFYDLAVITGGLILMWRDDAGASARLLRNGVVPLLWYLPLLGVMLNLVGLPLAPVALIACLALLVFQPMPAAALPP